MNQTIAGKYPVFGVSYISPSFLRFSRAGSTGRRCGWLGSRSQPAGETVDPSAVNPQEEPWTIVIGYGPVGRTLTRLLRENKLNPTVTDLNYDSVQSLRRGSGRAMARSGLRMMPTSPSPSLKFRTAGFPRYGFKASLSGRAFPNTSAVKPAPGMPASARGLQRPFARVHATC